MKGPIGIPGPYYNRSSHVFTREVGNVVWWAFQLNSRYKFFDGNCQLGLTQVWHLQDHLPGPQQHLERASWRCSASDSHRRGTFHQIWQWRHLHSYLKLVVICAVGGEISWNWEDPLKTERPWSRSLASPPPFFREERVREIGNGKWEMKETEGKSRYG